jgi:histidine triad (HIT) family protein
MCLFCQIANHQQKADIVYENEELIVFKDINPKALVHILIVPKKHIKSINELIEKDKDLVSQMIFLAKDLAQKQGIAEKGYRLTFNVGRGGGQLIDHLHLHLMGGGEIK